MRILHLIATLNGGGAERQLVLLARELSDQGIAVAIAFHGSGPNLDILKDRNVTLFPLTIRGNHDPTLLLTIYRIIRAWKPNLVQTWLTQMDIVGGVAARLACVPHILSERASGPAYGRDWKSQLRLRIGHNAHAIIANSATGAGYWQQHIAKGSMHVVANAVSPFTGSSDEPPPDSQKPYILYVGRLATQKNLANMIAGIVATLATQPEYHAYILGSGPLEPQLRDWIARTPISARIQLRGYVKDLQPWYAHAELLVSVSDFEGNPNVVLEAASLGCPLVLSDIPEHHEAIPADGAVFVDGHQPASIADGLSKVLGNRPAAKARAAAAKSAIAELSVAGQSAKYAAIYRAIVSEKLTQRQMKAGLR